MTNRDYVDHMVAQWAAERPDLDLSPVEIIGRISRISRRFENQIAASFRDAGLSTWAFYVLAALNRAGPPYQMKPTELYRSLLVSSGLMTTRISRLENAGLVERVPDPDDGRSVLVSLTPRGRDLAGKLLEEHNRREAAMLAPLTRHERTVVASSLRKLLLATGDKAPSATSASPSGSLTTGMASLAGPLHAEAVGPIGGRAMVFVHANPMDRSSWLFQVAHFSTWFRCVAVDLPGYGRSPSAHGPLSMPGVAEAVWESVDRTGAGEQQAVLVGCSIGSSVAQHMYHRRPERTAALVLCGTGWWRRKDFAERHIRAYREQGLAYRREFTLNGFSPDFRRTPLAGWFASLFMERNGAADLDTIIALLEAHAKPDPDWLQADLNAPALVISGSQDASHPAALRLVGRLPQAELVVIEGAGHACHIEQPLAFDRAVIDFLDRHGVTSSPRP